jgi:hypothetical protein
MSYPIGQAIPLIFRFTNDVDAPADPATVTATQRTPAGVTSTLTLTHPATGEYRVTVIGNRAGRWVVEVAGSGNGIDTSIAHAFVIDPSQVVV